MKKGRVRLSDTAFLIKLLFVGMMLIKELIF